MMRVLFFTSICSPSPLWNTKEAFLLSALCRCKRSNRPLFIGISLSSVLGLQLSDSLDEQIVLLSEVIQLSFPVFGLLDLLGKKPVLFCKPFVFQADFHEFLLGDLLPLVFHKFGRNNAWVKIGF